MGGTERLLAGSWVSIPVRQPLLLCTYLACREEWVGRDELLPLLWEDTDEASARRNLRQLLYQCRHEPWSAGLEVTRARLCWRAESDMAAFRRAVAAGRWAAAIADYHGELLDGVILGLI